MKQLVQKLADGSMSVIEVAQPCVGQGSILIRSHYSLISAGTEASTVSAARKSLFGKARERPEQFKQVVDSLLQQGVVQTYRAVSKKLDSYSPLGYSAAGVVIEVGEGVRGYSPGDRVACAGLGYASHAEIMAVPGNLCVRLPGDANLEHAAYNTLGAIALQGVRQADLRLGETCVVIGLGLLGQLTCLILRAGGIRTVGLDVNNGAVARARLNCADAAYEMADPTVIDAVHHVTRGIGADSVIITAATDSTEPVNFAGRLLRKRGSVVIVGNVPTGFDREPDYYRKELSLKMSCSYGPGRYDFGYEEKGLDYPAGYVRWTENRNMQAFQDMLHSGAIDPGYMTTHRFPIDEAPAAYDLILSRREEFLGILLAYDTTKDLARRRIELATVRQAAAAGAHGISFIGAGSYAMSHLLPNVPSDGSVRLNGVLTASGTSSRSVAEKFGFSYVAQSTEGIIDDESTGTVFIATRHDSHAAYVIEALRAGKNVFVEKPLCLNRVELESIIDAWQGCKPLLMVGFNRRFAPLSLQIKSIVGSGPMAMTYRVNAGAIAKDSWIQDRDIGGGRLIGEVCHFIDFMTFMNGSVPSRVFASAMREPSQLEDTININLVFENGSIGSIGYYANGPKTLPKEYVEIFKGGVCARLFDFRKAEILGTKRPIKSRLLSQDKGQRSMVDAFLGAVRRGEPCPIPLDQSIAVTLASFLAVESIGGANVQEVRL